MNMTESLPSELSTSCMATSDPSASPSGFSCVTRTNRSELAISCRTWSRLAFDPFSLMSGG